jgi:serine/threonine protein kinase
MMDGWTSQGVYSEPDARVIIGQVCGALKYMHAKGLMHKDIKPENIVISRSSGSLVAKVVGTASAAAVMAAACRAIFILSTAAMIIHVVPLVIVPSITLTPTALLLRLCCASDGGGADFGFARALAFNGKSKGCGTKVCARGIASTPSIAGLTVAPRMKRVAILACTWCGQGYFAPEMIHGRPFGVAVDVWSLGVTLYVLLTKTYPFVPTQYPVRGVFFCYRCMGCD